MIYNHKENIKNIAVFCFIIFGLLIFGFGISYETNDDYFVSNLVSGVYNNYLDYHMYFSNNLFGFIILIFNHIFSSVDWWAIFQIIGILSSMILISLIVYESTINRGKYFVLLVFNITLGSELINSIQFTKTAGILCVTGYLMLFLGMKTEKPASYLIKSLILVLIGSMIRMQSFYVISLFAFGIWIYEFKNVKKTIRYTLKNKYFSYFFALFFLAIIINTLSNYMYKVNDDWKQWQEYNSLRVKLIDYGFPEWNENKEDYLKLGFNENDIKLYSSWCFDDPEKLNVDNMKEILNFNSTHENRTISEFVKYCIEIISKSFIGIITFIMLIFCLINIKKIEIIKMVIIILLYIIINAVLFFNGRYNINRVNVVILLGVWLDILWLMINNKRYLCFYIKQQLAVLCMAFMGIFILHKLIIISGVNSSTKTDLLNLERLVNTIKSDVDNMYLLDTTYYSNRIYKNQKIFATPKSGDYQNLRYLGGWMTNSPPYNMQKEAYSIDNPYRALLLNENVYLVDQYNSIMKYQYLKDNYSENVKIYLAKYLYGYNIYKFYNGDIVIPDKLLENSSIISTSVMLDYNDEGVFIGGDWIYYQGHDSLKQEVYVKIVEEESGYTEIIPTTQHIREDLVDVFESELARYTGFSAELPEWIKIGTEYEISFILKYEGKYYLAMQEDIIIE